MVKKYYWKFFIHAAFFFETYCDASIVQELLAQIIWYYHIALLETVKDAKEREWYIWQIIQNGWSRNVLVLF
jgi:predicted nuclease of restriction endonuclease-like (RecB) superfamily